MTDPTTKQGADPPIGPATAKQATLIADECDRLREEALKTATAQIQLIFRTLAAGIVLLLLLPRLISTIDYWGREESLPPQVVENAERAITSLRANLDEMKDEETEAEALRDRYTAELKEAEAAKTSVASELRADLSVPFGVWRVVPGSENQFAHHFVARHGDPPIIFTSRLPSRGLGGANWTRWTLSEGGWQETRIDEEFSPILGRAERIYPLRNGRLVAFPNDPSGSAIQDSEFPSSTMMVSDDLGLSWSQRDLGLDEVRVHEFHEQPSGRAVILATRLISGQLQIKIMYTDDLLEQQSIDWHEESVPFDDADTIIELSTLPNGRLLATGVEVVGNQYSTEAWLWSPGQGWLQSPVSGDVSEFDGAILRVDSLSGGQLIFSGGAEPTVDEMEAAIYETSDGLSWTVHRPLVGGASVPGYLASIAADQENRILAIGFSRAGGARVVSGAIGGPWQAVDFDNAVGGSRAISRVASLPGGAWVATVQGLSGIATPAPAAEAISIAQQVSEGAPVPDGLWLPSGTTEAADRLAQNTRNVAQAGQLLDQQNRFIEQLEESRKRQENAIKAFGGREDDGAVLQQLDNALRNADTVRQAGQIVTRVAVIALLIYLVQIVVNRYRYLLRLAGFYQARAHGLRLLAADAPETGLLKGVTLTDLTTMLSPDGIGFDKTAEPPTSQMITLLQAALRKQ